MVNRDGALCPCLKINIKKIAAEPTRSPYRACRQAQLNMRHGQRRALVGSNGGWSGWRVTGLRELDEVEMGPL